jgi:diguanylate cyclase (GGDEF)-like protein
VTLRARLTVALVLAVVLPVIVASLVAGLVVPGHLDAQRQARFALQASTVGGLVAEVCQRATVEAEVLARRARDVQPDEAVAALVSDGRVSAAVVTDPAGRPVARAGAALHPRTPTCDAATADGRWFVGRVPIGPAGARGVAVVGIPANAALERVGVPADQRVALRAAGHTVAVAGASHAGGRTFTEPAQPGRPFEVAVTGTSASYTGARIALGFLVLALVLLSVGLARRLAEAASRPLAGLAEAAQRVAGGELDVTVPAEGRDEIGQVAHAFNAMTASLRAQLGELERSRDELRRSVERLGVTLSGTLDLDRILAVVLDTAMATTGATAGAVLLDEGGGTLHRRLARGRPQRTGADLAVPIATRDRTLGMIELHDKADGSTFGADDGRAVRALALHAAVAVENVLLHDEAKRLSVTDGLTGLWNRRYLMIALRREVERAARHNRPLAVLVVDIDRFKDINDEHGHQRGDAVLVEVAERLRAETRDSDIVARYGGEEFVLVLPETDRAGAMRTCARLCAAMRERPFQDRSGPPLAVTVSVGAALLLSAATSAEVLLRAADAALYAAKHGGRDGWRLADGEVPHQIRLDDPARTQQ